MKRCVIGLLCMVVLVAMGGQAMGVLYTESKVDDWTVLKLDTYPVDAPLCYTHCLTFAIDCDCVKICEATLKLDFTNDSDDSYGKFLGIPYDHREFVTATVNGHLVDFGEVSNGVYSQPLDPSWINPCNPVEVTLSASNPSNCVAVAWIDESDLCVKYEDKCIPEPLTMLGIAMGAAGLLPRIRRRLQGV